MPRSLRIIYPGACYHVMNRGTARQKIFNNNLHRTIFIELLQECCKLFNVKIYAYCLMSNHYHILLSTPDANLSRTMRHLNGVYTQKYNRIMKRHGSLFRGRYHAKLVEESHYLLFLTRYIHLNPVEACIVKNPADYKWSSYRAYLGLTKNTDWISINIVIEKLRQTIHLSHVKNYQDYVEQKNINDINTFISTKHFSPIIGSTAFKETSLKKIDDTHFEPCSTDINRAQTIPSIELIMENVCSFYQINYKSLSKVKSGKRNLTKLAFVYICNKEFGHKLHNIAEFIGYSRYESISAAIKKCELELKRAPDLIEQINFITTKIKNFLLKIS